jgi:hypothetical protein
MKLLTFLGPNGPEAGALDVDGLIVPLSRTGTAALATLHR